MEANSVAAGMARMELADSQGGPMRLLKTLARRSCILEYWRAEGWSELHFAVAAGSVDQVKYVLERGAKMETPLVVALRMQSGPAMISALLAGGGAEAVNLPGEEYEVPTNDCSCDNWSKMRWSPLHDCTDYQDPDVRLKVTSLLLNAGLKTIDPLDFNDRTPLIYATNKGQLEMVKLLVERGADPAHFDVVGGCAFHYAARHYHPGVLKYLLGVRPDLVNVGCRTGSNFKTALHAACMRGRLENVKLLLAAGASINTRDETGHTPAQLASSTPVKRLMQATERNAAMAATDQGVASKGTP